MRLKYSSILIYTCVMTAYVTQAASSPTLIPFQGRLTKQSGEVYTNGQYTVIFNLYDQAVGGANLWSEPHHKVGVINGMINVFLGSINPLTNVSFSETRHLGITIDADGNPNTPDPEMVPRQMIIPAFWAKRAEQADRANSASQASQSLNSLSLAGKDWSSILVSGNDPSAGKIKGSKIEDNSISGSQIVAGSINAEHIVSGVITENHLANNSVSILKLAAKTKGNTVGAGGIALSDIYSSYFTTSSTSPTDVPSCNVTITTTGRPVIITLVSGDVESSNASCIGVAGSNTGRATFDIYRDSQQIGHFFLYHNQSSEIAVPPGSIHVLDFPQAGTYNYRLTISAVVNSGSAAFTQNIRIVAWEL